MTMESPLTYRRPAGWQVAWWLGPWAATVVLIAGGCATTATVPHSATQSPPTPQNEYELALKEYEEAFEAVQSLSVSRDLNKTWGVDPRGVLEESGKEFGEDALSTSVFGLAAAGWLGSEMALPDARKRLRMAELRLRRAEAQLGQHHHHHRVNE
jgi:hypothetical protein